jgi:hypothetical protein
MARFCTDCGCEIPEERIEILPECTRCVACVTKRPDKVILDPEVLCAKASPSGQNGFSPSS